MSLKTLLKQAYADKFALGGFNFFNYESACAIAEASKRAKKPAILMVSEKSIEYYGLDNFVFAFNKVKKLLD